MKLRIAAVGSRAPGWAAEAFRDFAHRLPRPYTLELTEVRLGKRRRGEPPDRAMAEEARRLRGAVPANALTVALDADGELWSTEELARRLSEWSRQGRDCVFLIGGPDGLEPTLLREADAAWSLGPLTLPHMLARVIVAEQLYRAWSILENHPYHRGGS